MAYDRTDLEAFHAAVQTLKLYRRADLENDRGDNLIEDLYVDPLPNNHIYSTITKPNTTFIIGRKGTGKSTVFQRAQQGLLSNKRVLSTYIDIKTVYEKSQTDPSTAAKLAANNTALSPRELESLLLMRGFLKAVIAGIRADMQKQLDATWTRRFKEVFTGTFSDIFAALDEFLEDVDKTEFIDVQAIRTPDLSFENSSETGSDVGDSASVTLSTTPGLTLGVTDTEHSSEAVKSTTTYSTVLLRVIDIKNLILRLREILTPLSIKHLYVFVDDFSELPLPAMQVVVDVLLAPLNNWSDELIKFKVAAYPGRIYYGSIDKTKIDEISLDTNNLYGVHSINELESKWIDFTRRLIEKRLTHFGTSLDRFLDSKRNDEQVWRTLFYASMGNPRMLGYLLFFVYESQLIYDRPLTVTAIQRAARRYYETKIESYFRIGKFLHESFQERSGIYSLKELLDDILTRARALRSYDKSIQLKSISGKPPTSHFHVAQQLDAVLGSLELNFFLTKYYVMSDRDGRHVSIYALNYGLCEQQSIAFGRPPATRESRVYFLERIFDYSPIIRNWIAANQEIKCDNCGTIFQESDLSALRMYRMRCPACGVGTCRITNTSRKYEELLRSVHESLLLPETELGILQTLASEDRPMFAGEIAGELDVSPQLVGWRGRRLVERDLVTRQMVRGKREFEATDLAKNIYFADNQEEEEEGTPES